MRILVTAGPTREYLDPVRYISNRSSGKMGYAVAAAARRRGHDVVLVSGPVALPPPEGVRCIPVISAADMLAAVRAQFPACDVLIMAAAVADFRPAVRHELKVKKTAREPGTLALEPTDDILMALKPDKGPRLVVGFAAETDHVLEAARGKCAAKGLDLIVANDVTRPDAGFDVDTNAVTLVAADGTETAWPVLSKSEVAERLIQWVEGGKREEGREEERPTSNVERRTSKFGLPFVGRWALKLDGGKRVEGGGSSVAAGADRGAEGRDAVNARVYSAEDVPERLARQMDFIREIDKLKSVHRRTLLMDGTRFENDAEHSWHLAVMAALLAEYAGERGLDIARVIRMALAHDIVEIDAGDTYCYDTAAHADKAARETRAAERLFGLLPGDQAAAWRALWDEFEARETPEAKFAAALDRVQPLLHNFATQGRVWRQHGITSERVAERNHHVVEGSPALWAYAEGLIREAVSRGYLEK